MSMVNLLFWALALATLPGTIYLAFVTVAGSLKLMSRKIQSQSKKTTPAKIAVVIPAHNEEKKLLHTINSLQQCVPPLGSYAICVVADNCSDSTAEISRKAGCQTIERLDTSKVGKGFALNFAFETLADDGYDLFLVIDADTLCEVNILTEVEQSYSQGHHAIQTKNLISAHASGTYAKITGIGFRAMNLLRPAARDLIGLSVGLFGTGFALSQMLLKKVPYTANSVTEDSQYHLMLVKAGYKSTYSYNTGVLSDMPDNNNNAESQRARWEGGKLRNSREQFFVLLKGVFSGQWRLLEPLFELLLLPLSFHLFLICIVLLSSEGKHTIYALLSFAIIFAHVLSAILCTGGGVKELKTLLLVPSYIGWKLSMAIKIMKQAGKNADWVRAHRK